MIRISRTKSDPPSSILSKLSFQIVIVAVTHSHRGLYDPPFLNTQKVLIPSSST